MLYVKGISVFRISKVLSLVLAITALVSACYSAWWLRPLAHDGSRYAFHLINLGVPYYDGYRYLHGLFQLPTVFLIKLFPDLSPLPLTRIYFLTLTLPIYAFFVFTISHAKRLFELIIPLTILIIGYLPGNSFLISSMFETVFFFYLMLLSMNSGKKTCFYLFGFLAAIGHSAILMGFIILILLKLVEKYYLHKDVPKRDIVFLSVLSVISIYLTIRMMFHIPIAAGKFIEVLINYLEDFESSKYLSNNICILFIIYLYSNLIPLSFRKPVQVFLTVALASLLVFNADSMLIHRNGFNYRIFILISVLALLPLIWTDKHRRALELSFLTWITLFGVGSAYLIHDLRIGNEYEKFSTEISDLKPGSGCHLYDITGRFRDLATDMSFTFFKVTHDNTYKLDYLVFPEYSMGLDPCTEFRVHDNGIVNFTEYMWMSKRGRYELPAFIDR